jgi:hypothetical protein
MTKKGFKMTEEHKRKLGISKLGSKNPMWKGDDVKYYGLHGWIRCHKPKPTWCELCFSRKPYDLANISGKYKRDINDYRWLCRSCHMNSDGRINNLRKGAEPRKIQGDLLYCSHCKHFKEKLLFGKRKNSYDGYSLRCKDCCNIMERIKRKLKKS